VCCFGWACDGCRNCLFGDKGAFWGLCGSCLHLLLCGSIVAVRVLTAAPAHVRVAVTEHMCSVTLCVHMCSVCRARLPGMNT
jgi:hypothetical protein